jgi:adhesin transport system outer membrane protein
MQEEFREAVRERIRQGVSAEGDLARAESYIASAETRRAQLQRALAQAEARFAELTGTAPSRSLPRAPRLGAEPASRDLAVADARSTPQVRAAEAEADAARQNYRAARSELLPNVTAGIDAGRYGVFENERDYDVRARVTLRQRLFGGAEPRAEQAGARARAVEARADRVRQEAERDASIGWSDVQALEAEAAALRESYIAGRRSRDILFERFRVARGSLFDVLEANDAYFGTAVAYVQAISELDAARYVLLSRTGKLLEALDIEPSSSSGGQ